jgi:hypothetical protein
MDIPTQAELIARIEDFCTRHDMAETRFGRDAVNNPALLSGLRRDPPVSPTLDTLNKIRDFMAETDERASTREKLAAHADAPPPPGEAEIELPFVQAPVNPTGASLRTSSTTSAPKPQPAANGSCRASSTVVESEDRAAAILPTPSCSAEEPA